MRGTDSLPDPEPEKQADPEPEKQAEPIEAAAELPAIVETQPESGQPPLLRELDRRGKVLRSLALMFTVYHLAAMLTGGAVSEVRKHLSPLFGFYADTLRMTNSWGMFGKPPQTTNVTVETSTREQREVVISTTRSADRPLVERIKDVRIRKIGSKLADDGDRSRFGGPYLDYFCDHPPPGSPPLRYLRIVNHLHELRDDEGKITREASTKVLLTQRCGARSTRPAVAPPPLAPPPSQEGEL